MITSIAFPRKEMSKKKGKAFHRAPWISAGKLQKSLSFKERVQLLKSDEYKLEVQGRKLMLTALFGSLGFGHLGSKFDFSRDFSRFLGKIFRDFRELCHW